MTNAFITFGLYKSIAQMQPDVNFCVKYLTLLIPMSFWIDVCRSVLLLGSLFREKIL